MMKRTIALLVCCVLLFTMVPMQALAADSYILTYDANAGEDTVTGLPAPVTSETADVTVTAQIPAREGFTFSGWAKGADGTEPVAAGTAVTLSAEGLTLYALWAEHTTHTFTDVAAAEPTYTAPGMQAHKTCSGCTKLFNPDGTETTGAALQIPQLITVADTTATVSTGAMEKAADSDGNVKLNLTHADFVGTAADKVESVVLPVAALEDCRSLTIALKHGAVHFELDGILDMAEQAGDSETLCLTVEELEKDDLTQEQSDALMTYTVGKLLRVTITKANGDAVMTPETEGFAEEDALLLTDFAEAGYEVFHVDADGTLTPCVSEDIMDTEDTDLMVMKGMELICTGDLAIVTPCTSFTLTYDGNAGSDPVENLPAPVTQESNSFALTEAVPTRLGYTCAGWALTADATEPMAETTVTVGADGLTLYAVWEEAPTYTLTYDPNAGADTVTGMPESITANSPEFTLSAAKPLRAGYDFVGWALSADAAEPMAETAVTVTEAGLTLYAVWAEHVHTLERVEEIPATCTDAGTKEHWHCTAPGCDLRFADAEGAAEAGDLTIPAGHTLTDVAGTLPGYATDGKHTHKYCAPCGSYFTAAGDPTTEEAVTIPRLITVEGNTATVSTGAMEKAIDGLGKVTLNLNSADFVGSAAGTVRCAVLPVSSLTEALSLELALKEGTLTFDTGALAEMVKQAGESETVKICITVLAETELNTQQRYGMQKYNIGKTVRVSVTADGNAINTEDKEGFGTGTVKLTTSFGQSGHYIKYAAPDGRIVGLAGTYSRLSQILTINNIANTGEFSFVKPHDGYTLTYDANAGEDTVTDLPAPVFQKKDPLFTLSDAVPYREDYIFLGWSEDPDASEPMAANTLNAITANVTLYAVWTELGPDHVHTLADVDQVDPTYTKPGIAAHQSCTGCRRRFTADGEEVLLAQLQIPQLITVDEICAIVSPGAMEKANDGLGNVTLALDTEEFVGEACGIIRCAELPMEELTGLNSLTVSMADGKVTFDKKALQEMIRQAGNAELLMISIEELESSELNVLQRNGLRKYNIAKAVEIRLFADADDICTKSFGGGSVKLVVPFDKSGHYIKYVSENGSLTGLTGTYNKGSQLLTMNLQNTGDHVLVQTKSDPSNPQTGDNSNIHVWTGVMAGSAVALVVLLFFLFRKKKK